MEDNQITEIIIGKSIEIHKELGPGMLESAYRECLFYELNKTGLSVIQELSQPIVYKEIILQKGYRIDLVVNNRIILELKCVEKLQPVHSAQILTYMKFGNYPIGLLINFHSRLLKNGIKRFVY